VPSSITPVLSMSTRFLFGAAMNERFAMPVTPAP